MTDKKTYHSPFKRVFVTDEGGEKIKQLQEDFDKFWRKVHKLADKSPEKYHAQKAMQEACMWLSRACAIQNHRPQVMIDNPLAKIPIDKVLTDQQLKNRMIGFANLKEGQVIRNSPRIVVKKKRT